MAVDLFDPASQSSVNSATDLTMAPGSDTDQMIQLLEQVLYPSSAPVRNLPADPLIPPATPVASEDEALWFITDHDERVQIELEVSDITSVSGAINSTELWMLHRNDSGRGPSRFPK
jgi:hypothetical protein